MEIFAALLKQIINSPASMLVILGISVIGYLLEVWPKFNSNWIPVICILVGPVVYPFFASRASVPSEFPHPYAVLIVNGLVAGLVAFIIHKTLVIWAIQKLGLVKPAQEETEGSKGQGQ